MCARLGITDPAVFVDNDISAYSGKKRPGYLDLLERVKLGPSRIVAWHVDRLYRRPASWKTSSTSWKRTRSRSRPSRAARST
nr:recombinase family protein [Gordonia otitidis]